MTPKEAFKALADKKIIENAIGEYNTIRETFEDECVTIEQALTELEELKRDVKRFIELLMKDNPTGRDTFDIEILKDKLLKVGHDNE